VKNHVLRPLYLALSIAGAVLLARAVLVPKDFGVHERGYMYGWYRKGNEADWMAVKVKYRTAEHCRECHQDKYGDLKRSPHARINCENCHGPSLAHPDDPPTLTVDRSRELCLRCHSLLPYKASGRGKIRGIIPESHNPEAECVLCHYPHDPTLEARR
jgi:predicted CXXCH cytochrome family protein